MTLQEFCQQWNDGSSQLLVHTSGSTGKPKPIWVEKKRMEASAKTTCEFLHLKEGDTALLCMPLDYIAGKMMVVRSIVGGLRLIAVDPSSHPLRGLHEPPVFAAMVPLQVYGTLQVASEREMFKKTRHVIIGGGAIDKKLESELRSFPNAVWSTYGMTETLSHIALRRVSGNEASEWYTPFNNVKVSLTADGRLIVNAPLVCESPVTTNDIAEIAPDGKHFRILGRADNVICSGGIKLQIEEIETALHEAMPGPFVITKKKDEKFGETVVMLTTAEDIDKVKAICKEYLSRFQQPRHFIHIDRIPLTETGKPARAEAQRIAENAC